MADNAYGPNAGSAVYEFLKNLSAGDLDGVLSGTYQPQIPLRTGGYWLMNQGRGATTLAQSVNQLRYVPIWVGTTVTFDRIGCETTVAGSAGSVARLGVWEDGGGEPGTLAFDAGTVATDGATGVQTITISQQLTQGLYWIGLVPQTASGATFRAINWPDPSIMSDTASSAFQNLGLSLTDTGSVSGALPDPASPAGSGGITVPRLGLRTA